MRVQDVMSDAVRTVTPATSADDAWAMMRLWRVHHLVVIGKGELAGLLSDRDAGSARGAAVRKGRTVADLMTRDVVAVPPETPVRKAANLMRGRSIGSLIVRKAGRVVGIVTTADLLTLLGRGADRGQAAAKRPPLSHRVPHRKRHQAAGPW
jgi:CBS domain-containing protein